MNREEQLHQAADEWAEFYKHAEDLCDYISVKIAYKEGAAWADKHPKNVQHHADEEPEENEWVLAHYWYDTFIVGIVDKDEWACGWLNGKKLTRWAYIYDLLP